MSPRALVNYPRFSPETNLKTRPHASATQRPCAILNFKTMLQIDLHQTTRALRGGLAVVCLLALQSITAPAAAQSAQETPALGSRTPPPRAIVYMRKSISLGKAQGHRVRLKAVEITDTRFNPFLIQVTITGDKSLGIYKASFSTDLGTFETELPRQRNPRVQFGFTNAPTGADSTFSAEHREEHTFNITNADAALLLQSNTVSVTFTGRMQERNYTFKPKALDALKEWLAPRVEKYVTKAKPQ